MKKYCLLLGALLGVMCWSCKNDKDKDNYSPSATITLSEPAAGASVDLSNGQPVTFSWAPEGVTGDFTVKLSTSENLSDPQTFTATDNSLEVTAANLDDKLEALGVQGSEETIIYWAVSQNDLQSAARALKVKRIPLPPAASINLDAPADNATVDLSDSQDVIFSWTAEGVPGSSFTVTLSKSEDLSDPQTLAATDNPLTVTAADLDDKLAALGIDQGAAATIYWAVSQSDLQSDARALNVTRIPAVPVALTAPIANAAIALDYTTPGATIEFAWSGGSSAATYELVISKDANFTTGNILTVSNITGNSKPFTHQELQTLLIDASHGLKKYLDNTLYWTLKVGGEVVVATPGQFTLSGYKIFTDVRTGAAGTETITYEVSIITYSDGTKKVWLAENLRTKFFADGSDYLSSRESPAGEWATRPWIDYGVCPARVGNYGNTDGVEIPQVVRDRVGLYYNLSGETAVPKNNDGVEFPVRELITKITPAGWSLPTFEEFDKLYKAAEAAPGGIAVLRDPACYPASSYTADRDKYNAWNMNMTGTSRWIYNCWTFEEWNNDYSWYAYESSAGHSNSDYMKVYVSWQEDWGRDQSPNNGGVPIRLVYNGE